MHTVKIVKRQSTEWEEIFANYMFDKRLLFRVHKEPLQLNNKKRIQFKNGQGIWRYFSKNTIHMPNKHMQRYSTSLTLGNAPGTIINTTSYPLGWLKSKWWTITSVGKDLEKSELLYIAGGNVE